MTAKQTRNTHQQEKQNSNKELAQPKPESTSHPMLGWQTAVGNAQIARMVAQQDAMLSLVQPEVGYAGGPISNQLMSRIQTQRGRGNTLPQSQRGQMEQRFGVALDDVQIHTGAEADALNRSVSAKAFTIGKDIFFRGDTNPNNSELLAHELTHVVQQSGANDSGPLRVGPADDQYEHEADQSAAGSQATQSNGSVSTTTVQRGWMEDIYGVASNVAGVAGAGADMIMTAARGTQAAGVSAAGDALAGFAGSGVQSATNILGPIGLLTGGYGMYNDISTIAGTDDRSTQLQSATDLLFNTAGTVAGGISTMGLAGSGLSALGATGAGGALSAGAAAAAPVAAVAGSAAGGYALGRLLDEGVGALGTAVLGETSYGDFLAETFLGQDPSESDVHAGGADHSISGGIADIMTAADQGLTSLWADPDEPAYTQTIGWQLGELLGI